MNSLYRDPNHQHKHIFRERFKALAICLHHGDRSMAGFTGMEIGNDADLPLWVSAISGQRLLWPAARPESPP